LMYAALGRAGASPIAAVTETQGRTKTKMREGAGRPRPRCRYRHPFLLHTARVRPAQARRAGILPAPSSVQRTCALVLARASFPHPQMPRFPISRHRHRPLLSSPLAPGRCPLLLLRWLCEQRNVCSRSGGRRGCRHARTLSAGAARRVIAFRQVTAISLR
jgi:hypothetical protein